MNKDIYIYIIIFLTFNVPWHHTISCQMLSSEQSNKDHKTHLKSSLATETLDPLRCQTRTRWLLSINTYHDICRIANVKHFGFIYAMSPDFKLNANFIVKITT